MAIEIKKTRKSNADVYPKTKGECAFFINDAKENDSIMAERIIACIRESVNTLTDLSVKWISDNRSKYLCLGIEAIAALREVSNVSKSGNIASSEDQKKAIENFYRCFVNNIWAYENGLYKKKNSIISKWVGCYFVGYRNYDGEVFYFPLAVLKEVLNDEKYMQFIVESFAIKCSKVIVEYDNEMLAKIGKTDEIVEPVSFKKTFFGIVGNLFFICAVVYSALTFISKLMLPDWSRFSEVSENTSGFFQTLGFISADSFGISHNSNLISDVIVFSFIGLILALLGIFLFGKNTYFGFVKWQRGYLLRYRNKAEEYFRGLSTKFSYVGDIANTMKQIDIEECRIIREKNINFDMYMYFFKRPNFAATPNKASGLGKRILIFITVIILSWFSVLSEDVEFCAKYNEFVKEMSADFSTLFLKAESVGTSAGELSIYAKPDTESFVLLTVPLGETYSIVREKEPSEEYIKVKYLSEYGMVTGWIERRFLKQAAPLDSGELKFVMPFNISCSSDETETTGGSLINDLTDGNLYTSWKVASDEWPVGEYAEFHFGEENSENYSSELVKAIGIAVGKDPGEQFEKNARPVEFTIRFDDGGQTKNVKTKIEDKPGIQYIYFNKPVKANILKITVNECVGGLETKDAYISEIQVYSENNP